MLICLDLHPKWDVDGRLSPIPVGNWEKEFNENIIIRGRLLSTSTGRGAYWDMSPLLQKRLGFFNKVWNCRINIKSGNFKIKSFSSSVSDKDLPSEKWWFMIGRRRGYWGRKTNTLIFIFSKPPIDLTFKKVRLNLLKKISLNIDIDKKDPEYLQGHLEVWELPDALEEVNRIKNIIFRLKIKSGWRNILSHEVINGEVIFGYNFYRLIKIRNGGGWIVSPDHLREPLWLPGGIYLCHHSIEID